MSELKPFMPDEPPRIEEIVYDFKDDAGNHTVVDEKGQVFEYNAASGELSFVPPSQISDEQVSN